MELKFGEMSEFFKDRETKNLTDNGKCTNCGNCCSSLLSMEDTEIERIRTYCKRKNIKGTRNLMPFSGMAGEKNILDLTCPFLDNKKELKCMIYPVRPWVCRVFKCDTNGADLVKSMSKKELKRYFQKKMRTVYLRHEFEDLIG